MIELGTGQLNWCATERRSDRYGTVGLWVDANPAIPDSKQERIPWNDEIYDAVGRFGYLYAYVIETRPSEHIGDLYHGIFPEEPEVDERIDLGPGELITVPADNPNAPPYVGLRPQDDRETWWLHPHSLYRLHQQTVRLCFAEED